MEVFYGRAHINNNELRAFRTILANAFRCWSGQSHSSAFKTFKNEKNAKSKREEDEEREQDEEGGGRRSGEKTKKGKKTKREKKTTRGRGEQREYSPHLERFYRIEFSSSFRRDFFSNAIFFQMTFFADAFFLSYELIFI